jgi:hypothetical protein
VRSFFLFVFVLLSPIVPFLLSVPLIPGPMAEGADLKGHFFANHRCLVSLAASLPVIDLADIMLGCRRILKRKASRTRSPAPPGSA